MDNIQHACDPCSLDDATQNATSVCVVCVERLCDDCVKFHGKSKATRNHKILNGDDVPIDMDTFRLLAESAFCKAHPEREIQFKCKDHNEYICGICAINVHRHCEHMEEINSDLDENKAREECQLTINRNRDLCDKLSIAKIGTEEIIEKNLQEKGQAMEERKNLFQSIHELIIKLETKTYSEIDVLYENQNQILRSEIEKNTAKERQQKKDQVLLDATLKYANTKTMKIITNRTAQQLEITQKMVSDHENKTMEALKTNTDKFLEKLIKHLEEKIKNDLPDNETSNEDLLEMGIVNEAVIQGSDEYASHMPEDEDVIHTSFANAHLGGMEENSLQDCQDKDDTDPMGNKELHEIEEKENDVSPMSLMDKKLEFVGVYKYDKYEAPSGCVLLKNRQLVTIGTKLGRPIMSVFNTSMKVLFESVLDHDPYEICTIGEREVVITYSDYKRIDKFLILEDKIERHGGFHTQMYGRGITKHGNGIAVLFTDQNCHVDVNSRTDTVEIQMRRYGGRITNTITDFEDLKKLDVFIKDPWCILSLPNENILVGDKTHLRCFEMADSVLSLIGQCKWYLRSYKDHELKLASGMTNDGEGNILVCGNGSNNVHQLCATNYRQNRVLIPQINNPSCIAYDAEGERIIVGCGGGIIKVFKFV